PEPHDLWIQRLAAGLGGSAATSSAPTPTDLGHNVTTSIDRPISQPRWIDNRSLVAHVARGFSSALVTIDVASGYAFDRLELNPSAFARSTTGTIAYVGETTMRAPELWIKPANGSTAKVTGLNDAWSSISVAAPEF